MFPVLLSAVVLVYAAMAEDTKFLLMSSTRLSKVSYVALPVGGADSLKAPLEPQPLIETGLKSPGGITVHHALKKLFVADGAAEAIYQYQLGFSANAMHVVGGQVIVAKNVAAKWVACDVMGNLFYSDETGKRIMKVTTENIMRGSASAPPVILYSAATVSAMGAPGSIAIDNFRMYWADDVADKGAVLAGMLNPPDTDAASTARTFALRDGTVDGVCLTPNNFIFTGTDESSDPPKGIVYGMRKAGDGIITVIDNKLKGPGGCTWDGDGTIYVADSVGNAVIAVPSNMDVITPYSGTKTVNMEDVKALVVVSSATQVGLAAICSTITVLLMVQF